MLVGMDQPTPPPSGQRSPLHLGALLSFVLGLASFALCLLVLSGLPALVIGFRSLRAVNASGGQRSGAWLAIGGMILGGLATLTSAAGVTALVIVQLQIRSARTTCQDNLRRVGLSLNQYADGKERFPPAVLGPRDLPPERQLAWTCEAVPLLATAPKEGPKPGKAQLDHLAKHFEKIAGLIDRSKAWDDPANAAAVGTPIRFLLCPAGPDFDPNRPPGRTNYVGLSGIGPHAAALKRDDPRAGLFGYDRGVKFDEITRGTSHVLMALETGRDVGSWLAGGLPTLRELEPNAERYAGPDMPFGGLHPRLTNALYVDGSARSISDGVEADVLRRQTTLRELP